MSLTTKQDRTEMFDEHLNCKVTAKQLRSIDLAVENGLFANRSELIRAGIGMVLEANRTESA